ncbi:MAG TPA: type IV-A pilus assembly ATPase PilB [Candidatus Acidoferrales bacterium]|jgi:type IV pilus assembly protein PilB|nr:type IV-A pilus assembly ATPase PilB [Candidatus Acidoferrales bacterium]
MSSRLGEILVKDSLISADQLKQALDYQKKNGGRLGTCLVKLGLVSDDDITAVLSRQYGVPSINLKFYEVDPAVIKLVPQETAVRYQIVPLSRVGSTLTIAMTDPTNVFAMDDIKFMTGFNVEPVVASETAISEAIHKFYGEVESVEELDKVMKDLTGDETDALELAAEETEMDLASLSKAAEEAPIIKLCNLILTDAVKRGASDIHVEPYEKEFRVRFRIDGILQNVMAPPLKLKDAMTSRMKIMSKLDISEKRLPQDGRIMIKYLKDGKKKELDFRVSTVPTLFGEKIVLRLLDKENLRLDMTKLGFEPEALAKFERQILKPYGMVLVTGPTGSGKTNTLYSSVARLNTPETNIMTAEDPVEFQLPGINQVQMKEQIGLNFASALRAFLRQDPNIILVGEIRDFETAEIAVKAALTGHMVLSTLHTNDAPSTISRLMNMGIEPFLVATSVNLICAQRLVRRICVQCKEPLQIQAPALIEAGYSADEAAKTIVQHGKGCATCNNTGYKGRVGLYEVMEINDELRELILVGASALEIKKKALEQGMITLRRSGLQKVAAGQTTMEEVLRETVL